MIDWLSPQTQELLWRGAALTLWLTVITTLTSFALGVTVGAVRMIDSRWMKPAAGAFVEIFRNVPALIQIIFWAFAFPTIFPAALRTTIFFDNPLVESVGSMTGLATPYYAFAAALGLTLNTGAHMAELFRSGAGTLAQEHVEAARTLGAERNAIFRMILLPDGVRAAFPAMTTRLIHNMKNTALASFVAVPEFFHQVQGAITESFHATELLTLAALFYLALSSLMTLLLRRVDFRLNRGRRVRPA